MSETEEKLLTEEDRQRLIGDLTQFSTDRVLAIQKEKTEAAIKYMMGVKDNKKETFAKKFGITQKGKNQNYCVAIQMYGLRAANKELADMFADEIKDFAPKNDPLYLHHNAPQHICRGDTTIIGASCSAVTGCLGEYTDNTKGAYLNYGKVQCDKENITLRNTYVDERDFISGKNGKKKYKVKTKDGVPLLKDGDLVFVKTREASNTSTGWHCIRANVDENGYVSYSAGNGEHIDGDILNDVYNSSGHRYGDTSVCVTHTSDYIATVCEDHFSKMSDRELLDLAEQYKDDMKSKVPLTHSDNQVQNATNVVAHDEITSTVSSKEVENNVSNSQAPKEETHVENLQVGSTTDEQVKQFLNMKPVYAHMLLQSMDPKGKYKLSSVSLINMYDKLPQDDERRLAIDALVASGLKYPESSKVVKEVIGQSIDYGRKTSLNMQISDYVMQTIGKEEEYIVSKKDVATFFENNVNAANLAISMMDPKYGSYGYKGVLELQDYYNNLKPNDNLRAVLSQLAGQYAQNGQTPISSDMVLEAVSPYRQHMSREQLKAEIATNTKYVKMQGNMRGVLEKMNNEYIANRTTISPRDEIQQRDTSSTRTLTFDKYTSFVKQARDNLLRA